MPQLIQLYEQYTIVVEKLLAYENKFRQAVYQKDMRYLYSRIAAYARLSTDQNQTHQSLKRELNYPGSAVTKISKGGTGTWEIAGMTLLLDSLIQQQNNLK